MQDVDVYRCPRGLTGHLATYSMVIYTNGYIVEGTFWQPSKDLFGSGLDVSGKRVGSTVPRLTKLTDIVSPGAAMRAVFVYVHQRPAGNGFCVHYHYPRWKRYSPPPTPHHDGTTISMADGRAEYRKWMGRETIDMPRMLSPDLQAEWLEGPKDYEPQTEDGLYDLQRLQRATWNR